MHPATRLLAILLLLGSAFGTGVHYAAAEPTHWPYPTADQLASDYSSHVGERALLIGEVTVTDRSDRTARITVATRRGPLDLRVTDFDANVESGGVVQVYGPLDTDRSIEAQSVVVVNPDNSSTTYKYAVSVIGAFLILVCFFREWRLDRDRLAFVSRGD